jgi:phosphoribosyl 1,2-cyclic phosphodiesterase
LRVTVLSSGSSGNAILVEADSTRVLVDAGLPARDLVRRLEHSAAATRLDEVEGILCTHEHGDHAGAVPALASAGLAVYATAGTARALNLTGTTTVAADARFTVGALEVLPVAMPHDAAEPVGFIVDDGEGRVGVITACGRPAPEVAAAFASCDVLVLETNYDPDLLAAGPYPAPLKRRIAGPSGHLSNREAADLLRLMYAGPRPRVQVLILAHLSEENNRPRLARAAVDRALAEVGARPRVLVAGQDKPVAPVACRGGAAQVLPGMDHRQMRFAFSD